MDKIRPADLLDIEKYEQVRPEFRQEIMAHKQVRRIQLGPDISITFEDRRTIIFQIQEMMRAERLVRASAIQAEIDVYNDLIPDQGQLSATLFIEITQSDHIKSNLNRFIGLTDDQSLCLQVGDHRIEAEFEAGRAEEDKISSVHYIRFSFSPRQIALFLDESIAVNMSIYRSDYHHTIPLSPESRSSLSLDFD
ncbi:MAG: DUF3501 family protein [Candidatus Neomarinimicrobiota bacterium]